MKQAKQANCFPAVAKLNLLLFSATLFISCGREGKTSVSKEYKQPDMEVSKDYQQQETPHTYPQTQDLALYDLALYEENSGHKVAFVSISDRYPLSEHPDSLAIPDLGDIENEHVRYFTLDLRYRKRFLSKTSISETDEVFIYDYSRDSLVAASVKDLDIVANLSPYTSPVDWPYSQYDYMIGFEIDKTLLEGFAGDFSNTLVYVGKENPFVQGQINPVIWEKTDLKDLPSTTPNPTISAVLHAHGYGEYSLESVYTYEAEGYQYFVQNISDNSDMLIARRLLVTESKTKAVACDKIYIESDGTSLVPLGFTKTDVENSDNQWAGKLFKNKPPVIFGFAQHSFGCPAITFLSSSESDIEINCDNRH